MNNLRGRVFLVRCYAFEVVLVRGFMLLIFLVFRFFLGLFCVKCEFFVFEFRGFVFVGKRGINVLVE